jgi:hypothetical protein
MRPSWHRDLAALILLLAVCRSPAFADRVRAKPVHKPAAPVQEFKAEGYGLNEALAKKNALESLTEKVTDFLIKNHPEITYTPGVPDIEGMVRDTSAPEPWTPPEGSDLQALEKGPWMKVEVKAELTTADLQQFQAHTRNQLSSQRQALLARGLTGAVALLAVGTGYLKLEEKVGRHKKKLGAVAIGLLGVVGLGLLAWVADYF